MILRILVSADRDFRDMDTRYHGWRAHFWNAIVHNFAAMVPLYTGRDASGTYFLAVENSCVMTGQGIPIQSEEAFSRLN